MSDAMQSGRPDPEHRHDHRNMDWADWPAPLAGASRWGTLIGGGLLMRWGLRQGGLTGLVGLAAGGVMAWSGINGRFPSGHGTESGRNLDDRTGWRRTSSSAEVAVVTVNRPAKDLYRFWRDFSNLARVMEHIEAIEVLDDRRSRWTVEGPAGRSVSWQARVTEDVPDRRIAWTSEPGADVPNSGWVEFRPAPAGRGTEVRALIDYQPPAGELGRAVAKLFGAEPGVQMRDDLGRFKRLMEGGEGASDDRRPM